MLDINKIRENFPILNQKIYGKQLVYLDNGATTQKPAIVINKLKEFYELYNSNIHRGVHRLSNLATEKYENARKTVQKYINAAKPEEIIFTKGTTDSINLVASSFGEKFIKSGDEIIISEIEHHSNIVPWQMLCERKGAKLKVISVNDKAEILFEKYKKLLNEKTKLVHTKLLPRLQGQVLALLVFSFLTLFMVLNLFRCFSKAPFTL